MQTKAEDFLTVENNVVVLKVFPLLEPLWILMENNTHILPAAQNNKSFFLVWYDPNKTSQRVNTLKSPELLTHWPRTLWSCCRIPLKRNHFSSSAVMELCKGRHHQHRSPSSWSPHSAHERDALYYYSRDHVLAQVLSIKIITAA